MPKTALCLLVAGLVLLGGCTRPPEQRVLNDTAHTVIIPLYQQFTVQTKTLEETAQAFCDADEKTTELYQSLHYSWREAMKGWAAVQMIQFGPATEGNRGWRIEFWPDLKDLTARKVEKLLESDKPPTVDTVREASVIVQGLSALEYLLFDEKAGTREAFAAETPGSERRCKLMVAVASHTQQIAGDILNSWIESGGNYVTTFTEPGENNEIFPDAKAAMAALVDSLVFGIEQIKHEKLERPLGMAGDAKPNPYLLEWWRSDSAREAIAANLTSIQQLFTADNGFGIDDYLYDVEGGQQLSRSIQEQIALAHKHVAGVRQPLTEVGEDSPQRKQLEKADTALKELLNLLKRELPAALDITLSFNANDGD